MKLDEYLALDATGLARRVAGGEVRASELLELALAQHQRSHARINAVCRLLEADARRRAAAPLAGPLAGVPLLLKDIAHDLAGVPTSQGSRAFAGRPAAASSVVVQRLLDAGAVILGKTSLPELALKAVTDPALFGRCNNPWDPARTPGGSSGGSAAAVAAGVVPMATANDGGGSIRIPAAFCGLFGLRPSRGRVSAGPQMGQVWMGASSEGVISRSVRDSALALDILHGPVPGDPFHIRAPSESYVALTARDPGRLRIGYSAASPLGTPVHPEAVAAVESAASLLQRLGHEVEEAAPAIDGLALAKSYLHMYFGVVAATVRSARALGARASDFELLTRILAALGEAVSAGRLTVELERWNDFARVLGAFHARYDFLLTPTVAHPPLPHGTGDLTAVQAAILGGLQRSGLLGILARVGLIDRVVDGIAHDNLQYVPFTQLANLTGTPAMSVPLYWTAQGLPLGVQFVGAFGSEHRLLQLARQLEQAQPWFDRRPGWVGAA